MIASTSCIQHRYLSLCLLLSKKDFHVLLFHLELRVFKHIILYIIIFYAIYTTVRYDFFFFLMCQTGALC